jgi:hypothetical protein
MPSYNSVDPNSWKSLKIIDEKDKQHKSQWDVFVNQLVDKIADLQNQINNT